MNTTSWLVIVVQVYINLLALFFHHLGTSSDTASAPLPPNPPTVTPEGKI